MYIYKRFSNVFPGQWLEKPAPHSAPFFIYMKSGDECVVNGVTLKPDAFRVSAVYDVETPQAEYVCEQKE